MTFKKTILLFMLLLFFSAGSNVLLAKDYPAHLINGVPQLCQFPDLPTGCEITSLSMLLQYHGYPHSPLEIMELLPKGPLPKHINGKLVAGDPREVFVGDPTKKYSFGVYHQPILKMLEPLFPNQVVNASGQSFNSLLDQVKHNNPVLIWVTMPEGDQTLSRPYYKYTWTTPENKSFTWISNEHVMVMVGYTKDRKEILLNDPYTGKMQQYPYDLVKSRYIGLGKQAIYLKNKKKHSAGFLELYAVYNNRIYTANCYQIQDDLYIGLKDFAKLMIGSEKEFELSYYKARPQIKSNSRYWGNPETTVHKRKSAQAIKTSSTIYYNQTPLKLEAYEIGAAHYYNFKALAKAFNLKPKWKPFDDLVFLEKL